MILEFWVMRVVLHKGRVDALTEKQQVATRALVNTGDLACLPDGSIAEPVEVFKTELDANAHRVKLQADNADEDYRVIINTDVDVAAGVKS